MGICAIHTLRVPYYISPFTTIILMANDADIIAGSGSMGLVCDIKVQTRLLVVDIEEILMLEKFWGY